MGKPPPGRAAGRHRGREGGDGGGCDPGRITFVRDRPGHDRCAIDCAKIERELGWRPSVTFEEDSRVVDWYLQNTDWVRRCAPRTTAVGSNEITRTGRRLLLDGEPTGIATSRPRERG